MVKKSGKLQSKSKAATGKAKQQKMCVLINEANHILWILVFFFFFSFFFDFKDLFKWLIAGKATRITVYINFFLLLALLSSCFFFFACFLVK